MAELAGDFHVKFSAAGEEIHVKPAHAENVPPNQNGVRLRKAGEDCEVRVDLRSAWKPEPGAEYRDALGFPTRMVLK